VNPATPLVSILTPSFNQAAWLPDNLRSIASQTYPHVEHIVMDGGSTDGSLEVLANAGDEIRWRSEADRGQADAINKAFRESTGEIIGWLNSDDAYFDAGVIAAVVEFFGRHGDIDVVYGHCLQTTQSGRAIQVLWAPPFDADLMLAVNLQMQPSTFMRRSALTDPMLDDTFHFAMDYELWLRLATTAHGFARLDRFLSIDRHQSQRKSSTIKDVNASDLKRLEVMYGTHLGPQYDSKRSRFYVKQRLMGALLIRRLGRARLAFDAPQDFTAGLLRRQLFTRKSDWPAEFR